MPELSRLSYGIIDRTVYDFHFFPGWDKLPVTQVYNPSLGNVQSLSVRSLEEARAIEGLIRFPEPTGDATRDARARKMITMVVLWSLRFGSPLEYLWSTELNTADPIHFAFLEQHVDRLRSRHLGDMRDAYKRFPKNAYVFPAGQSTSVLDTDALDERQKVDVYVNQTSTCIGWSIAGFRH
jgi:hypothetical protein